VPFRETPLHLAVRLNDVVAARTLGIAGADVSLQNAAGWNPLQEALCRRSSDIALVLLKLHHRSAWCKWRRRLPRVIAVLRRMRDFYMEISFHFESSVIPFVGKIAPSDTYKIWKRDESVGEWKARVYEVHNVIFSFRSRKVAGSENDVAGSEQVLPLELDEDDDGFLVCENPNFAMPDRRRHSSFVREDREWISVGRKSVDVFPSSAAAMPPRRSTSFATAKTVVPPPQTKEKEYVRSLRPSVWLTEQFPLKTEELLPLLDILANKVKAVRRMRELLTTKFPPGTFPVKIPVSLEGCLVWVFDALDDDSLTNGQKESKCVQVAIPVVPTVRVVITFTKFVELQSTEQFFTPLSSPRYFSNGRGQTEDDQNSDKHNSSLPSTSWSSSTTAWLRRSNSQSVSANKQQQQQR
ncbi:hypothetical protein Gotri_006238, partial [Gossypium trilobum]|nr:hypothetical protein [Gossypium trilobum]